jgi:eukaryotic-like serine/threonine-protein kinase
MSLQPGSRLGPYEVVELVGAGGMGEVYRARDTRLGRDLAVKVLPAGVADPDRLRRFEQEARAASSLNHPNIVTIHDIGTHDMNVFVAMELVEGPSLRETLHGDPLPARRVIELGAQIAEGLAKAHAVGIVHRDLKPDNVMLSRDGFVKIVDFGLAKLAEPAVAGGADAPTIAPATTPGMVMGTVGYMSPEQASGQSADFRSDQFSFGTILYEMVTGRKAFERKTSAETLTAIIREDPEPLDSLSPRTPAPLRWIIERCLEKNPDDRYASTKDLARDLKQLAHHLSDSSAIQAAPPQVRTKGRWPLVAAGVTMVGLSLAGGYLLGHRGEAPPQPSFARLTFNRGLIATARFTPEGQAVAFSAAWDGQPLRTFTLRPGSPQPTTVQIPDAQLLSISDSNETAILLNPATGAGGFNYTGTLARVPLSGGAPKPILDDATYAEWAPGSGELLVVHRVAGRDRLEFPIGTVLHESSGWIQQPRFAADGKTIAYIDHPNTGDSGEVALVDLAGHVKTLSTGWASVQGLAWSSDGREVWFTAAREGTQRNMYGVTADGTARIVRSLQGTSALLDVARTGDALLTQDDYREAPLVLKGAETAARDLGWFDWTGDRALTPDGKLLLFDESGEGAGPTPTAYLRPTDGAPAVRLADGLGVALTRAGDVALVRDISVPEHFVLVPVGAGQPRALPPDGFGQVLYGAFVSDGTRIAFEANEPGRGTRLFVQDVNGGKPAPVTAEGLNTSRIFVSPDGRWISAIGSDTRVHLFPSAGGAPKDFATSRPGDSPAGWSADGLHLYVSTPGIPARLDQIDVTTGERTKVRDLSGADPAGVMSFGGVRVTPDGQTIIFSYVRILSTLYRARGLR